MFKRDLRQKSHEPYIHETRSIVYGPGVQYLLNTVQYRTIKNV